MKCSKNKLVVVAQLIFMLLTHFSFAQWTSNVSINTPIALPPNAAVSGVPVIISDSEGGAILVWTDVRNGSSDIYAQRVDDQGFVQWTSTAVGGIATCTIVGSNQLQPACTTDGAGGAIIVWTDQRNGDDDIYAQRVDFNGNVLWGALGRVVCTVASSNQNKPNIVSDTLGGAIIGWTDMRNGNADIFAQRIDSNGNVVWTTDPNGVPICTNTFDQSNSIMTTDGLGGALFIWGDYSNGGSFSDYDLFAQRILPDGSVWFPDGVNVCGNARGYIPNIVPDGLGGAFVSWLNNYYYSRVQHLDATGNPDPAWPLNGKLIAGFGSIHSLPTMISDGVGGAILAWFDDRLPLYGHVFAQRVTSIGNLLWGATGKLVSSKDTYNSGSLSLIADGNGGAILGWDGLDDPFGVISTIRGQRINSLGDPVWPGDELTIASVDWDQNSRIVSDGAGGAIYTWEDIFGGSVRVQNVCANGVLGVAPPRAPLNVTVPANLTICYGFNTALSAQGIGAISWYSAPKGGTYLGTGSYSTPVLTDTTTFYVQDSTCSYSRKRTAITVIVHSLPTLLVSSNTSICSGEFTTLSVQGASTYAWFPTTGLSASIGSAVDASPPTGRYSYTITGTSSFGCINSNSLQLMIIATPTLTTSSATTICMGDTISLSANLTEGILT